MPRHGCWPHSQSYDHGEHPREALLLPFIVLILVFILRAWVVWLRERVGFHAGQHIRYEIRRQVLDRLQEAGPAWIQGKPAGSWATLILEQIDDMHDYYARYLPQMALAVCVPLLIVITIFPVNWVAALILLGTAPLIPCLWRWWGWERPMRTAVTSLRWVD
ncbi:cysteine ABC transporter ATP-binding protein/permease [Enterobacter cloacae]|uniref:Cysteine ABC transporter ATP-binding protein/permease n=1 Tax=Enterobacter cloacae TaxID=550 RepID=A0A377M625_ENTCL|nr:cysteine ABC transporter ATP-binding protein/permease [Enterobacter cloacae]